MIRANKPVCTKFTLLTVLTPRSCGFLWNTGQLIALRFRVLSIKGVK